MYFQIRHIYNQHALMSSRLQLTRSWVWTDSVDKVNNWVSADRTSQQLQTIFSVGVRYPEEMIAPIGDVDTDKVSSQISFVQFFDHMTVQW